MPKTYEQLLKDQTSHIKPPTITIDLSHLMEEEEEEDATETMANEDNSSTTSGVTEGPEVVEDAETVDKEPESGIELFGINDGYAVTTEMEQWRNDLAAPNFYLFVCFVFFFPCAHNNYRPVRITLIWKD